MTIRLSAFFPTFATLLFAVASARAEPVAHWDFGTEETSRLKAHGGVHRDQAGPRPPAFPGFAADNTAVAFDGDGARFIFDDPGEDSPFDFSNGDTITLEAWVNLREIGPGENRYVIGKGRTGNKGFSRDNQNWALRVRESGGRAGVSFLFASEPRDADGQAHWHRWTSREGFRPGTGWHHIAVTYQFGKPESIGGWIDGKAQAGAWDMGGATTKPPVVDNDAIWIGSALGGSPGNSFRGLLDDIAIHRAAVPAKDLAARFHRVGPPPQPAASEAPAYKNLFPGATLTLAQGLYSHERWPMIEVEGDADGNHSWPGFFLHRLPHRYDRWGVRESWETPVLARFFGDVELPAGSHQFLVRARGLSRLWVDGKIVAGTKAHGGSTDGHNPVTPVANPPAPGLAPVPYGDQEVIAHVEIPARARYRVILESMIGGKNLRATTGTMLVALRPQGAETFSILNPVGGPERLSRGAMRLTRSGLSAARAEVERKLQLLDNATRRRGHPQVRAYWKQRHQGAKQWAEENPPPLKARSIDSFLNRKIYAALHASKGEEGEAAKKFHSTVLPILRENCFRCHGDRNKGDLRLDTREAALHALTPGKPEESELMARIQSPDDEERMPPKSDSLTPQQIEVLRNWIASGAEWPAPPVTQEMVEKPGAVDDHDFLRRVYLDIVGVPPTVEEIDAFLNDHDSNRRMELIDNLLRDSRYAGHWVSYWQDVLAENPNMLKPSLNNTGPFRWFLHEALLDNKPFDRLVTDLIMMRGSEREGGSAGFGLATDNDAPFAAKAHIIGNAFLGIEMQCARCHDSPYHSTKQRDLYSLAAMLERKEVTVPKTSRVPAAFFEKNKQRESLIKVTLQPDEKLAPAWPFAGITGAEPDPSIKDTREQLAALITAPENARFAEVTVNRLWRRLMGTGIVEPPHDWEGKRASHPKLLKWLAWKFVASGYDLKHIIALIMNSDAYAREAGGNNRQASPELRFFTAPDRRRLSAEQVVDSLYAAAGSEMDVEELTFDPDGRRPAKTMISLGFPKRAWELTSLSNERDRPSLALPRAQAVSDVLEAFGWVPSRQNSRTDRELHPNVLQPGVLANSTLSTWITRASDESDLAQLAVDARSPEELVRVLFLRFLTRIPSSDERNLFTGALAEGFEERLVPTSEIVPVPELEPLPRVSWSNHLDAEANRINLEMEARARRGPAPDPRLKGPWRETYEDLIWTLVNSPEFVWMP